MNNDPPLAPADCPKVNTGTFPAVPDVWGSPVAPVAGDEGALEPKANGLGAPVGAPNVKAGAPENGLLDVGAVGGCVD